MSGRSTPVIGVIHYDASNLRSVANALGWVGAEARLIDRAAGMDGCDGLVLPGVGAFRAAMTALEGSGLADGLRDWAGRRQRPLLGVCAGMQLLASRGVEGGETPGLALVDAAVLRITPTAPARVPHIGWNAVDRCGDGVLWGDLPGAYCYFAHSFAMTFADAAERARWVVGDTDHGGTLVAMVEHGNVMGTQFHPEKSQRDGLAILRRFVEGRGAMVRKRLVVSLLWRNGVIVQSVRFRHTNVVGDPKVAIEFFNAWDADEIVLLNVGRDEGTPDRFLAMLQHVSRHCFLPLTAGGWVTTVAQAQRLLEHGADKLVVNTRGFDEPAFLGELADKFGAQCVVAALDVLGSGPADWQVAVDRGRRLTGMDPVSAARRAVAHGAGEILLTSIERDGSLEGYDLGLVRAIAGAVDIPVIAFGGVGQWSHLKDGIDAGADAVAAGNIFHFTEQSTRAAKTFLIDAGAPVRPR